MLREAIKRFKVLILVLAMLSASVVGTRAESGPIHDAIAAQVAASENAQRRLPTALRQIPRRARRGPCNPGKRAMVGAAIGTVMAMVVVRRIAADYDSSIGAKGTLQVGGLGAGLGGFIGLAICARP